MWNKGCIGTATIRGIFLKSNWIMTATLVARSPHIEHVPFILPVPGPVVVVVSGDVGAPAPPAARF